MDGRWMKLEGPNHNADNAFLMKIGSYLVIEFARQNNACHVFDANYMPFSLGQSSVLGTQEGLKNKFHPGHRRALRHGEGWQGEFASFLRWNLGVTPPEKPIRRPKRSTISSHQGPISSSGGPYPEPAQ